MAGPEGGVETLPELPGVSSWQRGRLNSGLNYGPGASQLLQAENPQFVGSHGAFSEGAAAVSGVSSKMPALDAPLQLSSGQAMASLKHLVDTHSSKEGVTTVGQRLPTPSSKRGQYFRGLQALQEGLPAFTCCPSTRPVWPNLRKMPTWTEAESKQGTKGDSVTPRFWGLLHRAQPGSLGFAEGSRPCIHGSR